MAFRKTKKAKDTKPEKKKLTKAEKKAQKTDKKKTSSNKKKKKRIYDHAPRDAWYEWITEWLLVFCVIGIAGSWFYIHTVHNSYTAAQLKKSMPYGTQLPNLMPLSDDNSAGNLTLGNSIVSNDGHDMAVKIDYDQTAHQSLSAFGNRYKIRLITTPQNPMKDVKITYGMFGTDGSGVLQLHSDEGFKNQAFAVVIIDESKLLSSAALNALAQDNNSTSVNNNTDDSITAQLSNLTSASSNSSSDSSSSSNSTNNNPPNYLVRLNPANAKKLDHNFTSTKEVLSDLFLDDTIQSTDQNVKSVKKKIEQVNAGLKDMNERLAENPNDSTATAAIQQFNQTLSTLQNNLQSAQSLSAKLKDARDNLVKNNILNPQETKHKTIYLKDLSVLNSINQNS